MILPNLDKVIIPAEKFTNYALDPEKQPNKALAFEKALGYNLRNYQELILNISDNLDKFHAKKEENKGFGDTCEMLMELTGANGKPQKL